jgi:general secretion pathway protein M
MARLKLPNFSAMVDRMSARERRLLAVLGAVLGGIFLFALPIALEVMVFTREADAQELGNALSSVQDGRARVLEHQYARDLVAKRYARRAPNLSGFIEEQATKFQLQVADSQDRPDQPHGKKYSERQTTVHFKRVGMGPVLRFLEAVEKSGFPIIVSHLNLRKRGGEVDSFDVEVVLSAFDKVEKAVEKKAAP